jgi:hypothetical protein
VVEQLQERCPAAAELLIAADDDLLAFAAAEQDRPDVATRRRRWRGWQRFMDPERFVFLDETATTTDMARRYGRSPLGERLVAAVPQA